MRYLSHSGLLIGTTEEGQAIVRLLKDLGYRWCNPNGKGPGPRALYHPSGLCVGEFREGNFYLDASCASDLPPPYAPQELSPNPFPAPTPGFDPQDN